MDVLNVIGDKLQTNNQTNKLILVAYITRQNFWYSLMMIPFIPFPADPYACFAYFFLMLIIMMLIFIESMLMLIVY